MRAISLSLSAYSIAISPTLDERIKAGGIKHAQKRCY